jgi:hypothetical protein
MAASTVVTVALAEGVNGTAIQIGEAFEGFGVPIVQPRQQKYSP